MAFYRGTMFPAPFANSVLVTQRHSWVPDLQIGSRLSLVRLGCADHSTVLQYDSVLEGFLNSERTQTYGTPADVAEMPDGSLLLSDDFGAIYRITYDRNAAMDPPSFFLDEQSLCGHT